MTTILPTAAAIAEWRAMADGEIKRKESINLHRVHLGKCLRQAADACTTLLERVAELEGLRQASGMGMGLPCSHCRNVFQKWREVQVRLKELEKAEARIAALESERDCLEQQLIAAGLGHD